MSYCNIQSNHHDNEKIENTCFILSNMDFKKPKHVGKLRQQWSQIIERLQ